MRKLFLLLTLLGSCSANASIVTWNVNAVFDDGGTLTGSFDYDESISSVVDQDLVTAGGTLQFHSGAWDFNSFSGDISG